MEDRKIHESSVQFGALVRTARLAKDLTQQEVADRAGISQVYYNTIEKGKRNLSLNLAMELCRILELDLNEFVLNYHD